MGGLLQSWTTTAVESAARVRSLEPALARSDLVVEGQLVVERSGPSRVEPAERLAERERLQELLNRVTAVRSRELARLRRELEHVAGEPRRALRPVPVRHLTPSPGAGAARERAIACRP